jgi:uncharacterized protein DUF4296
MTRFFSLLFFCSLISCANKESIPSGIIPKDEMQKILWDMIQADQFSKQYIIKDSAKKNVGVETMKLYNEVFQVHHITKDEFQKSYQFYISRPDILKIVFDSLSAQGNRRMHEVYQTPAHPKKSV